MTITPASCTSCQDGSVMVTITGPARPYEYRLSGPGIAVPTWTFGGSTDIPSNTSVVNYGSKIKTYTGLLPGTYMLDVASDLVAGTRLCVKSEVIVIPNLCPEPPGDVCKPCGSVINIVPKPSISSSNPAKHVRFAHIPKYEIGDSSYTIEAWVKPLFDLPTAQTVAIATLQSIYGPATTVGEQVTTPAPFLYHTFRLVVEGGIWFLFAGFNINYTSNFSGANRAFKLSTDALVPHLDKPNHVVFVVRDIIENSPAPTEDWEVDNTTTALSNKVKFNKAISFYLNGVLIDTIHPDSLASVGPNEVTLTSADRLILKNINNLNGYIVVGGRYFTMDSLNNGQITNFRWYGRTLESSEIRNNYILGCHGDPTSCDDLLLYAPLSQMENNITPELIEDNFGELQGFTNAEYEINGGAWTKQCCYPLKLTTSDFECPEIPCGNALLVKPKPTISNTNPAKHVKYSHINQYNIGEARHSFEAWVQPLYTGNIIGEIDVFALHSPTPITTSLAENETSAVPYLAMAAKIRYENGKYYMRFGCSTDGAGSWKTVGPPQYQAFFVCTDEVQMSNTEANHCVWIVKDILENNPTPTQPWQIDNTQPNSVNKPKVNAAIEFWVNGVLIDTLYPTDDFDIDNQNECILDSSARSTLRNMDKYTGPLVVGNRYYTMRNTQAPNGKITNIRWYNREMTKSEIQTNYLLGCDASPSNCSRLLLYSPLNQDQGAIVQELIYSNFGALLGYTANELKSKGGAWVNLCCGPKGNLVDFNCEVPDCDPNFQEVNFQFNGGDAGDNPFIITVGAGIQQIGPVTVDFASCPLPAALTDYPVYVAIDPALYPNSYSQAVYFVSQFNALVGNPLGDPDYGVYAVQNFDKVTIKFALATETNGQVDRCGIPFNVCLYDGTNTNSGSFDITPYTGSTTITYPKGQFVKCCVIPDPNCDANVTIQ